MEVNMVNRHLLIIMLFLWGPFQAQAHDPKEHLVNTEQPDCAALKTMDFSKIDEGLVDIFLLSSKYINNPFRGRRPGAASEYKKCAGNDAPGQRDLY